MSKDNLEKFIEANRLAWEDQRAPAGLWEKIDSELTNDSSRDNPWKVTSAILFAIIILAALAFWLKPNRSSDQLIQNSNLEFAELEDFRETEHFYLNSINVNYQKLDRYGMDATIASDLSLLDSNYKELLEEYKTAQGAFKEQVLRAIIQNYKTKLQILERVLSDLEQSKQINNERIF